jgi:integrase
MADMKWLKRKGNTWYVIREVPRDLRGKVLSKKGKPTKRLVRSLDTDSQSVALSKRHAVLAEFEAVFQAARRPGDNDQIIQAALNWRAAVARLHAGDLSQFWTSKEPDEGATPQETAIGISQVAIEQTADELIETHGPEVARSFLAIAHNLETPLLHYIDAWLNEGGTGGPVAPRTQRQYRSDLAELESWVKQTGLPPTIEAVTKPVAGRYVTDMLANGTDRKTASRKVSAASSYWRWLLRRTSIDVNPWGGQSVPKAKARTAERPKRPFTDAEVAKLLSGPADPELADVMRMAALTGARVEELYQLRVHDCREGVFRINRSKTQAGIRQLPIHSGLAAIITRRTKGKPDTARLFPEPGEVKEGRERSMAVSKRFGHYRKRLGVDDRIEGRRQSRIDLHSFRRWFVTVARQAGIDRAVVAACVGHEAHDMTDGTYSGGPSLEQRRQCVESVRLPAS